MPSAPSSNPWLAYLMINLSPVHSILLAMVFLGERLAIGQVSGAFLVLGGCLVAVISPGFVTGLLASKS